jgi:CspA family cold shock protein
MPMSPAAVPLGIMAGVVMEFDDPRGLGVVVTDGGMQYPFHCANIADGSRRIDVGAAVTWKVVPGRLGTWEAADLRAISGANAT